MQMAGAQRSRLHLVGVDAPDAASLRFFQRQDLDCVYGGLAAGFANDTVRLTCGAGPGHLM
jgi:hypothetical protein